MDTSHLLDNWPSLCLLSRLNKNRILDGLIDKQKKNGAINSHIEKLQRKLIGAEHKIANTNLAPLAPQLVCYYIKLRRKLGNI